MRPTHALQTEAGTTVIRPTSGWVPPRFGELWHHRQLLYFLAWRDLKVRYAQTLLGAVWTVFQPIALMVVFTLAFQRVGNVKTQGVPYQVFVLAGLTFWNFFSRAVTVGADSLTANAALVTKTSCPRLVIPLASLVSAFVDFAITLAFFFIFAAWYGTYPTWRLVVLPFALLLGIAFIAGLVLLLSALNVRYRDVRQALPFLIQLWLFLSPVAYPISLLGPRAARLLTINPLVGIIDSVRWSLIGTNGPSAAALTFAIAISIVTLVVGLAYFARAERTIADLA